MTHSSGIAAADNQTLMVFASPKNSTHVGAQVTRLLKQPPDIRDSGMSGALDWCRQNRAEILIIDIDGHPTPQQAVKELLSYCDPSCHLIAVGSQHDINLYRGLSQLGVVDYLTLPVPLDLLANALERARTGLPQEAPGHGGRTVAITGAVGGVGCSTLVASLAQLIANQRRVATSVVDFDQQKSDQLLYLGHNSCASLSSVIATSKIDQRLLQRSLGRVNDRLSVIAQGEDAVTPVEPHQVLEFGAALCQLANLVLWDIPSSRTGSSLEVLQAAQIRILVTEYSVNAARQTRELLQTIGDESDGQRLFVVANYAHAEQPVVSPVAFEEFIGRKVDIELPNAGRKPAESLLHGALSGTDALLPALNALADQLTGQASQASQASGRWQALMRKVRRQPVNRVVGA